MTTQQCTGKKRWLAVASLVSAVLLASSGCHAWQSAAVSGLVSKQGERQVLRQAKQDPFPSPSDVGME